MNGQVKITRELLSGEVHLAVRKHMTFSRLWLQLSRTYNMGEVNYKEFEKQYNILLFIAAERSNRYNQVG